MPYYSHGIVDAGTSKSFVYDPGLRSRRNIRITEYGDLNEIYRRTYNDTTLYKPIKGKLVHRVRPFDITARSSYQSLFHFLSRRYIIKQIMAIARKNNRTARSSLNLHLA